MTTTAALLIAHEATKLADKLETQLSPLDRPVRDVNFYPLNQAEAMAVIGLLRRFAAQPVEEQAPKAGEREEFEAWAESVGHSTVKWNNSDAYRITGTTIALAAWQAATERAYAYCTAGANALLEQARSQTEQAPDFDEWYTSKRGE